MARAAAAPASGASVSFLDILANTVGALLFVLIVMIVCWTGASGGARMRAELAQLRAHAEARRAAGARREQEEKDVAEMEKRLASLKADIADLRSQAADSVAEAQRIPPGGAFVLPVALSEGAGAGRLPTHVECRRGGIGIRPSPVPQEIGMILADVPASAFGRLLDELAAPDARKRRCIVLWVFPGGEEEFAVAQELARTKKIAVGWEPAEAGWSLAAGERAAGSDAKP